MFVPYGDNIERQTMPIVPVLLIVANAFVFAYQVRILTNPASGDPQFEFIRFLNTWGLIPTDLPKGRAVGLLTYMFLHGDLSHIAGNMLFLWTFACSLEVSLGRWTFLGFYLLFGISGGIAHALSDMSNELPLVGASGAVAGLIGAYTVLYGPTGKIKTFVFLGYHPRIVSIPAWTFGVGWFVLQVFLAHTDPEAEGGVAWFAHIGGFVAGVATMLICRNDSEGNVQDNGYGYVVLESPTSAQDLCNKASDDGDRPYIIPETCPYCDQPLNDTHRFGDQLARCGNQRCQRMIYLEADAEPGMIAESSVSEPSA